MTIEIRQLIIRAEVRSGQGLTAAPPVKPTDRQDWPLRAREPLSLDGQSNQQDELVATCVRAVLRRLERSRER